MAIELSNEHRLRRVVRAVSGLLDLAGGLLGFFLEELGPVVFNQAVAQVQERLQMRIMELDIEVHEDEFQYWRRREHAARGR